MMYHTSHWVFSMLHHDYPAIPPLTLCPKTPSTIIWWEIIKITSLDWVTNLSNTLIVIRVCCTWAGHTSLPGELRRALQLALANGVWAEVCVSLGQGSSSQHTFIHFPSLCCSGRPCPSEMLASLPGLWEGSYIEWSGSWHVTWEMNLGCGW